MEPIIEARGLTKRYGALTAVDNISFAVQPGEVFGFLGPNGAGKTTTMKMIQCVSPKTGGSLTVFGKDVDSHPREIKDLLGVLPQEANLDPEFTCIENLTTFARYFGISPAEALSRAEELLTFVQLDEKRDVKIEKLSGGMKRRLLLARALINNPRALFADEPCANLDSISSEVVMETLLKLNKDLGITILFVSHDPDDKKYAKRLIFLKDGKQVPEYL